MRLGIHHSLYRIPSQAWAGLAFMLAALAVLPGARATVDLRAICGLEVGGRFGITCDLSEAAAKHQIPWLGRSLTVFEDGTPLRDVNQARQVRKQGLGTYVVERETLFFSSIDGSSPLTNGRKYEARTAEGSPGLLRPPARAIAMTMAVIAIVAAVRRSTMAAAYRVVVGVSVLCLTIQAFAAVNHAPIHVDAGFSLPSAREVAGGRLPYRDFLYNYTPLGVMALAGWRSLWPLEGVAAHTFSLLFILLLEGGCAYQVYRVCRALRVARGLAGAAALSYLSMFMSFDGSRMLFEPMYLLVVLSALHSMLTSSAQRAPWVAGGLASLALFIKQYGGFGFWGALFACRGLPRPAVSAGKVILGATIVLVTMAGALLRAGVDLSMLVGQTVLEVNYPRRLESVWILLYFRSAPFLVLAPALFLRREWRLQPGVTMLGGYFVASWMPLLVRQHQYYLQNPSPFLFAAFATLVAMTVARSSSARGPWIEALALMCLVSLPIRAAQAYNQGMPPIRGAAQRRAELMTSFWPSGQPVLMFASPSFLALTGYRSPSLTELGYRFVNETPLEAIRAGMRHATAAWIDPTSMYARGDFARAGASLKEELVRHGFEFQMTLEDRYELWTKGGVAPAREPPLPIEKE